MCCNLLHKCPFHLFFTFSCAIVFHCAKLLDVQIFHLPDSSPVAITDYYRNETLYASMCTAALFFSRNFTAPVVHFESRKSVDFLLLQCSSCKHWVGSKSSIMYSCALYYSIKNWNLHNLHLVFPLQKIELNEKMQLSACYAAPLRHILNRSQETCNSMPTHFWAPRSNQP